MSKRQERAVMLYKSGYNCAQAVAIAYSEVLGMSEEKAGAIFSGFGGGFGGQHEVCGAVSAMTAVLGALLDVKDGDADGKKRIYSRVLVLSILMEMVTYVCLQQDIWLWVGR
jgi:C_GCAxxG_C_C family probable redox protein